MDWKIVGKIVNWALRRPTQCQHDWELRKETTSNNCWEYYTERKRDASGKPAGQWHYIRHSVINSQTTRNVCKLCGVVGNTSGNPIITIHTVNVFVIPLESPLLIQLELQKALGIKNGIRGLICDKHLAPFVEITQDPTERDEWRCQRCIDESEREQKALEESINHLKSAAITADIVRRLVAGTLGK